MTWEELKEKAKKFNYYVEKTNDGIEKIYGEEKLCWGDFQFFEYGYFFIEYNEYSLYCLARERTPDQMWQIIQALS